MITPAPRDTEGVTFPLDRSIPYVYHIRISAICIPYKDISHTYAIYSIGTVSDWSEWPQNGAMWRLCLHVID